jgi:hypothetical protein
VAAKRLNSGSESPKKDSVEEDFPDKSGTDKSTEYQKGGSKGPRKSPLKKPVIRPKSAPSKPKSTATVEKETTELKTRNQQNNIQNNSKIAIMATKSNPSSNQNPRPIVLHYGKETKKNLKKLKRGRGPVVGDVEAAVRAAQAQAGDGVKVVPIVVHYKQKR